jgi:hypothetical protein
MSFKHLIIQCPYVSQIWKDVEKLTGIPNLYDGSFIEEYLGKWFRKEESKAHRVLHFLVHWVI